MTIPSQEWIPEACSNTHGSKTISPTSGVQNANGASPISAREQRFVKRLSIVGTGLSSQEDTLRPLGLFD